MNKEDLLQLVSELEQTIQEDLERHYFAMDYQHMHKYKNLLRIAKSIFKDDPILVTLPEDPDAILNALVRSDPSTPTKWALDNTHYLRVRISQLCQQDEKEKPSIGFKPPHKEKDV